LGASSDAGGQRSGLTGARDEHSVLFSLSALTSGAKAPSAPPAGISPGSARNEDSGLIDLNALATAQQASKVAEEAAPLAAPSPLLFPAALGTVEAPQAVDAKKKSSMPMIIGGGVAAAGIAIAVAIFAGGKKEEVPLAPVSIAASAPIASAATPPLP